MDASSYFRGKKITLMGLGLLGRGVGDAKFLAEQGADLIVTDLKTETELASSFLALSQFLNIHFVFGAHRLEDFENRDLVIYGPKVPLHSPYLAHARKKGVPTTMSTALFAKLCGVPVVGVTGTRGKTTTTALIEHALRLSGKKTLLGGNIRGVSTLSMLPAVTHDTIPVLELDSWQLQGFRDEGISPHIAVFTNLMPDHRDYYPDEASYFGDKANIFKFQKSGDVLIAGKAVASQWIIPSNPPVTPRIPEPLKEDWPLKLIGRHNRDNAGLAREALLSLGLNDDAMRKSFASFAPIQGRFELLREVNGVKIYNDNNATTPTATAAALAALTGTGKISIIIGGADKNLPLSVLSDMVRELVATVVLLPGTGTDRFKKKIQDLAHLREASSISEALALALEGRVPGDSVLFSPAFASFGLFKNEYDRNDTFIAAVEAL